MQRLAGALRQLAVEQADRLDELRARARALERPDFLWWALVQAASTWGSSRGAAGVEAPENRRRLAYREVRALSPRARTAHLRRVLGDAGVRWAPRKAGYLARAVEQLEALGGAAAARRALLAQEGFEAKARFLRRFPGVGPKYARDVLMDVYHPDARDRVALDVRVLGVAKLLGLDFARARYEVGERFFRDVAAAAALEAWAVDRLIFWFQDDVCARLRAGLEGGASNAALTRRVLDLEARLAALEARLGEAPGKGMGAAVNPTERHP